MSPTIKCEEPMEPSTSFIFLALAAAPLLLALYFHRKRSSAGGRLPPGPPCYAPILGHLPNLLFAGKSLHRYLACLSRIHGPILSLRLGSKPALVISSPELAREFLHTHDTTFANRPSFTSSKYLGGPEHGGSSITLLPYGDPWRHGRKLYTIHLLSARRIQDFQSTIIPHEIRHLISTRLLNPPPNPAAVTNHHSPALIDLTACLDDLLENIICRILLGQRPSQVMAGSSGSSLSQLIRELAHLLVTPLLSDFVPWLGFLDYSLKASMNKWRASFTAIIDHVIAERKQMRAGQDGMDATASDILDVFLLPENNLDRDMILVYITELLTAGIETSSATLGWAMSELLANPRVLAKLRAELDEVVGLERCVEPCDIARLPYMQAVVKETFRKHPPVPLLLPHMSSEACEVAGGYTIPGGTRVLVNTWAMGRDPGVWREPEAFVPERFVGSEERQVAGAKGQGFELLPFGSGRRACPGMGLGTSIVHLALSALVHSLEWELPPHGRPEYSSSIDMSDELGLICHRAHPLLVRPPRSRLHIDIF